MYQKKSYPFFNKIKADQIDLANGIISGVVIIQEGKDKVGDTFDTTALQQLVTLGNSQTVGLKSRFGHPNACNDSLGTYIGRYKNFSLSTNTDGRKVVTADLHLSETSKALPSKGDVHSYILKMAETESDMFGNSIVYMPDEPEIKTEKDATGKEVTVKYERFKSFIASDLVDSPAATTSLFKDVNSLSDISTEFLNENPEIFELLDSHPEVLNEFLGKFKSYKQNKMTLVKKSFQDKLKDVQKSINDLFKTQKDISATASNGDSITISDTDGDGVPMPGDMVTDSSGSPMTDATIPMDDGSTIHTDGTGSIVKIDPKAVDTNPVSTNELSTEVANLKKQLEDEKAARKAENELAEKALNGYKEKFDKIISDGYNPKDGPTQFRKKEPEYVKPTKEEMKAAIQKELETKNKK